MAAVGDSAYLSSLDHCLAGDLQLLYAVLLIIPAPQAADFFPDPGRRLS